MELSSHRYRMCSRAAFDQRIDHERIKLSARGYLQDAERDAITPESIVKMWNVNRRKCIGDSQDSRA